MERVVVTRMFPMSGRSRFLGVPRGRLSSFIGGLVRRGFQADSFVSSSQRILAVLAPTAFAAFLVAELMTPKGRG